MMILKKLIFAAIVILLFTSMQVFPQNKPVSKGKGHMANALEMSKDLTMKLNLTSDQQVKLNDIFMGYQMDINKTPGLDAMNTASTTANEKINSILLDDQKTKWLSIKDSWWNDAHTKWNLGKSDGMMNRKDKSDMMNKKNKSDMMMKEDISQDSSKANEMDKPDSTKTDGYMK